MLTAGPMYIDMRTQLCYYFRVSDQSLLILMNLKTLQRGLISYTKTVQRGLVCRT
jgi:hypothetical protein